MMRLVYAIAVGLALAGVVHLGTLLGIPAAAPRPAYERLASLGADGRFAPLPDEGPEADLLPFRDPSFVTAACRYDLAGGPVTVRATLPGTYGALAIHTRAGLPFYALTDRAATDGVVEVTILDQDDVAALELEEPADGRPPIRIVSPTPTGFALVRLFAPAPSARAALRAVAEQARCGPAAARVSP